MGWLNDWLADLGETTPAIVGKSHNSAKLPILSGTPRQPKPEIKSLWFQTRSPQDGDMGAVEAGHYWVADGAVTICDENGKPTGKTQRLGPNDDARKIAGRLAREAWSNSLGGTDFNRPLHYQRDGFV
jgi:hypothetical protein